MELTDRERDLVCGILGELLGQQYKTLNQFLGSETIKEMQTLHSKMYWDDYCKRHGIKYEDMDDFDFERAYREMRED